MQVPAWILVILTVFSTVLLIVGCFVLIVVIKYRLKHRKYEPIKTSTDKKSTKYIPGKTAAYFSSNYADTTVIPLTYPTTLQSGTPPVFPSFRQKNYYHSSQRAGSYISPKTRTVKYPFPSPKGMNRCASLDDQLFRKTFSIRTSGENKPRDSPLTRDMTDSRVSSRSSFQDTDVTKHSGYVSPPENIRISTVDTFYSHSEFFSDDDSLSLNPSTTTETENIISYDQDTEYKNKTQGPAFLTFQLEYHSAVPELLVTVKHAFDLPPTADVTSNTVNSYVNLCLVPEDFLWQRTRIIENEQDPIFEEVFQIRDVLYHKLREYTLCLFVMDSHSLLGERPIGKILYPLSELRAEQAVDVCQELSPP